MPCWSLSESKISGLLYASWGNVILKMQHSTTRQTKQKISANLDHHWSEKCCFLYVQTNWICPSRTQRFCKYDSDSSHWLRFESLTRVTLSLVCPSKIDLHVFFWKCWVPFFEIKQRSLPFMPKFSAILLGFSTNQNFWGCAFIPASCTTWCTVTWMYVIFSSVAFCLSICAQIVTT